MIRFPTSFGSEDGPFGLPTRAVRGVLSLLIKYYNFNIPKILGECTPLAEVVRGVLGEYPFSSPRGIGARIGERFRFF